MKNGDQVRLWNKGFMTYFSECVVDFERLR